MGTITGLSTITGISTLRFFNGSLDPDAENFITATGIVDSVIINAIDALVISAKANSWWSKCVAIYPFVGGTSTTHKYNLKSPQDTNAAFRLVFNGSFTHASTGIKGDGTTGYINTFLTPSTALTANDTHISYYSREATAASTKTAMGVYSDGSFLQGMLFYMRYTGDLLITDQYQYTTCRISTTNTDTSGLFLSSRISSSDVSAYRNGSQIGSTVAGAAGTIPSNELYISALNQVGTATNFESRECAFASVGAGINSTIASSMYTNIQTFQTSLSRNV